MGSLFLLNSCCEQAAAGMLRAFLVHFVPLQSTNTQCNMHDSHAATENCMKCGISHISGHILYNFLHQYNLKSVNGADINQNVHVNAEPNAAWEPHVNLDSLTIHPVSQRKWSKFHLKIPARESQHILQSNLSQTHSYHGLKRPKRKEIATCGKFVSPQQLLWASCCPDAQGISCSFCAIAIQQHTV